jgi:hypothetical protein
VELIRRSHPFHFQGIIASEQQADGRRTLIIAEPPPHVTVEGLRALDPALTDLRVKTSPIGIDGWVKDAVIDLPSMSRAEFDSLVDRLQRYLFFTSYKAWVFPMESAMQRSSFNLNLRVSAAQLQRWLLTENEQLVSMDRSGTQSTTQLLHAGKEGVYVSKTPGIVVWIVPKRSDISQLKINIRQFVLDSDLILGAIPAATHVAIIARERQVPVSILPPLRSETILLLAAVNEDELAQSYERNDFLAGKLQNDLDWAPIYLSDSLIDTEYGSLLNITDQLLKSWTNHGKVNYMGFEYPRPSFYPFETPLGEILQSTSLLYNWNTKGAAYSVTTGNLQTFALNRTGALPVTYLPEGANAERVSGMATYENTAYDKFSGVNDPNLARVVQYAALYQIFRQYGISSHEPLIQKIDHPEMQALTQLTASAFQAFTSASELALRQRAQRLSKENADGLVKGCMQLQRLLQDYAERNADPHFLELAAMLSDPRHQPTIFFSQSELQKARSKRQFAERFAQAGRALFEQMSFIDIDRAQSIYKNAARRESQNWIKTPSHVVSESRDKQRIAGGHNLDSKIFFYETDASVPEGKIIFKQDAGGKRRLLLNPKDAEKASFLLRDNAVSPESEPLLRARLERILATTTAKSLPRNEALALNSIGATGHMETRGLLPAHLPDPTLGTGWRATDEAVPVEYRSIAAQQTFPVPAAIAIERNSDYTYKVFVAGSDIPRTAKTYDAAVDAVVSSLYAGSKASRKWDLHFKGLDPEEATRFRETAEIQIAKDLKLHVNGFDRTQESLFPETFRFLNEHYDLARARVVNSSIEPIRGGPFAGGESVNLTLELPSLRTTRLPIMCRLKILFRQHVSEPIKRAVEATIARALRPTTTAKASTARQITGRELIMSIHKDLKRMGIVDKNVRVEVSGDWGDLRIAEVRLGPEVDG